jgi:hypothetical protein
MGRKLPETKNKMDSPTPLSPSFFQPSISGSLSPSLPSFLSSSSPLYDGFHAPFSYIYIYIYIYIYASPPNPPPTPSSNSHPSLPPSLPFLSLSLSSSLHSVKQPVKRIIKPRRPWLPQAHSIHFQVQGRVKGEGVLGVTELPVYSVPGKCSGTLHM